MDFDWLFGFAALAALLGDSQSELKRDKAGRNFWDKRSSK